MGRPLGGAHSWRAAASPTTLPTQQQPPCNPEGWRSAGISLMRPCSGHAAACQGVAHLPRCAPWQGTPLPAAPAACAAQPQRAGAGTAAWPARRQRRQVIRLREAAPQAGKGRNGAIPSLTRSSSSQGLHRSISARTCSIASAACKQTSGRQTGSTSPMRHHKHTWCFPKALTLQGAPLHTALSGPACVPPARAPALTSWRWAGWFAKRRTASTTCTPQK